MGFNLLALNCSIVMGNIQKFLKQTRYTINKRCNFSRFMLWKLPVSCIVSIDWNIPRNVQDIRQLQYARVSFFFLKKGERQNTLGIWIDKCWIAFDRWWWDKLLNWVIDYYRLVDLLGKLEALKSEENWSEFQWLKVW